MDKTIDFKRFHLSLTKFIDPCLNTIYEYFILLTLLKRECRSFM